MKKKGKVPKNKYGNVELWTENHMPKGCIHITNRQGLRAAKQLKIDYAKAFIKFEWQNRQMTPKFEGIVVCQEFKDILLKECDKIEKIEIKKEKNERKMQQKILWDSLIKGIMIRKQMNEKRYFKINQKRLQNQTLNKDCCDDIITF